jgi:hypothetical protein
MTKQFETYTNNGNNVTISVSFINNKYIYSLKVKDSDFRGEWLSDDKSKIRNCFKFIDSNYKNNTFTMGA